MADTQGRKMTHSEAGHLGAKAQPTAAKAKGGKMAGTKTRRRTTTS